MKTSTGSCRSTVSGKRRVVIAGGGYAGSTCAVSMARALRPEDDLDILLLTPDPCQQALSELDLVAVGPRRPQFCELWHPTVFRNLPVTVCYNRLTDVHPERHTVVVGEGEELAYWRLVLATGAVPVVPPIPGLHENAITMWSVADAQSLQDSIEAAFKTAARLADRTARPKALSFTVVGGGATGVEIVGTLAHALPKRLREHGLSSDDLRLHLVEGADHILGNLPPKPRAKAARRLAHMGVEIITDSLLERLDPGAAILASGRRVDSAVVVWAGGVHADPHAVEWDLTVAASGRLVVDKCLRAPAYQDIYIIGDVAEAKNPTTGQALPMLAQMATQEGPATAANILREARGRPATPFRPHLRGEFVSVGPTWGIGCVYGICLTGLAAIVMKRITYFKYWLQVGGLRLAAKRTRELMSMKP